MLCYVLVFANYRNDFEFSEFLADLLVFRFVLFI